MRKLVAIFQVVMADQGRPCSSPALAPAPSPDLLGTLNMQYRYLQRQSIRNSKLFLLGSPPRKPRVRGYENQGLPKKTFESKNC